MNENFNVLISKMGPKGVLLLRVTCDWVRLERSVRMRKEGEAGFVEEEQAPKMLTDDKLIYRIYHNLYLPHKKALDADYKALNTADPRELEYMKASGRTQVSVVDGDFTCDFDLNCKQHTDAAHELVFEILQLVQDAI